MHQNKIEGVCDVLITKYYQNSYNIILFIILVQNQSIKIYIHITFMKATAKV
jgi:5,10-methylenetetrahydrofolate reductase